MRKTNVVFYIAMIFTSLQSFSQTKWYVKTTGTTDANSGTSWSAPTTLHNALSKVIDGDTICIAEGTYIPQILLTNGTNTTKDKCFEIKKNITLIGGYPADAADGSAVSNPQVYPTVLSGKLDETNNSFHVVAITATTATGKMVSLSGLTIRDGMATGTSGTIINSVTFAQNSGGGVYAMKSGVINIENCIIEENTATKGAGCDIEMTTANMSNTIVRKNVATTGQAGGVYLTSVPFTMNKMVISDNTCATNAAGLYIAYSSGGIITNSVISGNQSGTDGAGLYVISSPYICLLNSSIYGNSTTGAPSKAGGIYITLSTYMLIGNCTIFGNSAITNVGAIGLYMAAKADIISSTITHNRSVNTSNYGGIYADASSQAKLYNSILSGNNKDKGLANGATFIPRQSIVGNQLYDAKDSLVAGVTFAPEEMLDSIHDNGGTTPTCKLLTPTVNPALQQGLPSSGLFSLASLYTLPGFVLTTDQRNKLRPSDKVAMGAYQDSELTPNVLTDFWHLIMYGQSLSAGTQSWPPITNEPIPNNYMIGSNFAINFNNQNLTTLSPLFASPTFTDQGTPFVKNTTDGAKCENAIIGAANHIQQKLTDKVSIIATSCGYPGASIEQCSKQSTNTPHLYDNIISAINNGAAIAAKNHYNISCPATFWMQGESNYTSNTQGLSPGANNVTDKNGYKALLLTLKNYMQTDIMQKYCQPNKPLFITYQVGEKWIVGFEQGIAMAQLEASNQEPDMVCAGPVYMVTGRANGHRDPNGYRWYGEMLGKVFYKTFIQGEKFMPLQPKKITKTSDRTLRIDYLVPVKPLVFDSLVIKKVTNYGFVVKDNGTAKTISSVKLLDNEESVQITCSSAFIGDIEVAYGGLETSSHGNLRDSDPYQSFYKYVDLDAKDAKGNFIYERAAGVSTLHPDYEPRDKDGVIYGKSYPLYNCSLHFYYKIPSGDTELVPSSLVDYLSDVKNPTMQRDDIRLVLLSDNNLKIIGDWTNASIYDISGKKCLETPNNGLININSIASGIYIAEIYTSKNQKQTAKFVK
ncbi:MAG TPA: right-handed parallel beta-helix repeat-containing protein [Paludibacter sp.]|nr:right-handed parallel beta-helix repeat-containing protein [Paludibacter sp.]